MRRTAPGPGHAAVVGKRDRPVGGREVLVERCEACGTEMYGLHCKLVCPNCGYKRDCSDP